MAESNVDHKTVTETKADESRAESAKRNSPWRKQPSVLKGSSYKIGDGEPDFVD